MTFRKSPFFGSHQIEMNQGTVAILKYHFNRHILQADGDVVTPFNAMAENADTSTRVIRTLDERGVSMLEDWVSAAISDRHLWPDEYACMMIKVIGTIGRHGRAVIVGRGANFVLPPENRFRVRIIAPFEKRVACVAEAHGISKQEAKQRVLCTESERKAFIRKYFYSDIGNPANYDMVLNTGTLSVDSAAAAICSAIG
jgi:cytidylate kinase